jgi:hypothetical protein
MTYLAAFDRQAATPAPAVTKHDAIIRAAVAKCELTFNQKRSPDQEARAHLHIAKASLTAGMEVRRYDLRCFPGLYRRDRAVCLRASVARLELAAKRRRYAAELLARAVSAAEQKAA